MDGTSQHAGFARVLKEGGLNERMQAKAKETFSPEWKAQNGAALLTDEALFSFLARAQSFWVGIAEETQKEMWMAEPPDAAGDQGAEAHCGQGGGADDDVL